jgi:hypothetical protein
VTYPIEISQLAHDEEDWTAGIGTDDPSDVEFYHFNVSGKQQNYFQVSHAVDLPDFSDNVSSPGETFYHNSTYDGLALGLQSYLGGSAYISKVDNSSLYSINRTGSAQLYLQNYPASDSCGFNFSDPFEGGQSLLGQGGDVRTSSKFTNQGLIGKINSIMFGLATDVSNMDYNNNYEEQLYYTASVWQDTIYFKTNFWYMAAAAASTIICVLCVLPSYYGYWRVDHKLALEPLQIVNEFRGHGLHDDTRISTRR